MTIPNDPDSRWWVEVADVNPALVDSLRPALLSFMAFSPSHEPSIEGCGFVVAGETGLAIALTAKHVLSEGVVRKQKQTMLHAPSAVFVTPRSIEPSNDPRKLKAAWFGQHHVEMLNVDFIEYCDTLDIAVAVITPHRESQNPDSFRPTSLPVDTAVPNVGDVVHMISKDNQYTSEVRRPTDRSGRNAVITVGARVSMRIGVVTGVHPNGFRQYKWPCFTTSIPAEPGMSGGLVMLPADGKTMAACGIVCADNSAEDARNDNRVCGESVAACAWPALALQAPDSIPSTATTAKHPLYDFMRSGRMPMAIGGIDNVELVELEGGNSTIKIREQ